MSAAVFLPDPLLARVAPAPSQGGFDVQALLSPVAASFSPDPLLSPPPAPDLADAEVAFLEGPVGVEHGSTDSTTLVAGDALPQAALDGAVLAPELQALLEQRWREGFEEGMAEGARLGHENSGDGLQAAAFGPDGMPLLPTAGEPVAHGSRDVVLLLESLSRALQPVLLPDDAAARFEPLKRLALHLAMELVRTELSLSPKVVEELVRRSVQALQAGEQAPLTVELHPQDLALLRQALNDPALGLAPDDPLLQRVSWREDPQLTRGSVRARSDVSTVEDLIQHRLASIMHDLRIQSIQWQQDESALQQGLIAETADSAASASTAEKDDRGEAGESSEPADQGDGDPHA